MKVGLNLFQITASRLSSRSGIYEKVRIWELGACRVCPIVWSYPCLTALSPASPDPRCGAPGALGHNYYILQGYFSQFGVCNNMTTQL